MFNYRTITLLHLQNERVYHVFRSHRRFSYTLGRQFCWLQSAASFLNPTEPCTLDLLIFSFSTLFGS